MDKVTTIEWRGYYLDPLPPLGPRDILVSPFQLHNQGGTASPMFAFEVNVRRQQIELGRVNQSNARLASIPIAPY